MKTNLQDMTFLIPIRLDSIARLENLIIAVDYIEKSFVTNITVLEGSNRNNGIIQKMLGKKIKYVFQEDKDPIFYRTMYLNKMIQLVDSKFLGIWDADVIIDKKQIVDSISNLRNGDIDIAYPYDGEFLDTTEIMKNLYVRKKNIGVLHKNKNKMYLPYGNKHIGGAIIVNKEKYEAAGGENEKFYGWGPEDFERYARWKNLNYRIYRSSGPLYHLSHPRSINSGFNSELQQKITSNECGKTEKSTAEEIIISQKKSTKTEMTLDQ